MLFLFVLRVQVINDKITNSFMVLIILMYMIFKNVVCTGPKLYTSVLQLKVSDCLCPGVARYRDQYGI